MNSEAYSWLSCVCVPMCENVCVLVGVSVCACVCMYVCAYMSVSMCVCVCSSRKNGFTLALSLRVYLVHHGGRSLRQGTMKVVFNLLTVWDLSLLHDLPSAYGKVCPQPTAQSLHTSGVLPT